MQLTFCQFRVQFSQTLNRGFVAVIHFMSCKILLEVKEGVILISFFVGGFRLFEFTTPIVGGLSSA
uniref:Uncharacterized protein n=1 Tax=uncultured marine virus TaxID=186617 RepID=A0A0F7L512_9VIRU|nr:hypothetical protein [uncultured marine virus]